MFKILSIGMVAAAAVGVMTGGAMRPDSSQFVRPGQELISETPSQPDVQPTAWSGVGPTPSYVTGTDSQRAMAMADDDVAYVPPADATVYTAPRAAAATHTYASLDPLPDAALPMQPIQADWKPHPDTRPAKDDRADAIRQAQAAGPQITIPTPAVGQKADFPSLTGDTMRGLGADHDGLAKVEETVGASAAATTTEPKPARKRPS